MHRTLVALVALCIGTNTPAQAAGCGQTLGAENLAHLIKPITASEKNLNDHVHTLADEMRPLTGVAFDRAEVEFNHMRMALDSATHLRSKLLLIRNLVIIRDQMLDRRDRLLLESYLSVYANEARSVSRIEYEAATGLLGKLSRPGFAVEVGQYRDAASAAANALQSCE